MPQVRTRTTAREKLLASAQALMLERGYNGTTVDEICAHAGVSKGSFYHFFDTKEDLGLGALDQYYQTGSERFLSGRFQQETDPKDRLIGFLKQTEARSEDYWGAGCLLGTFAVDFATSHPQIRQRVAEQFDQLTAHMADLFRPAAGGGGKSPTARELAAGYLAAIEGGIVMARAASDPARLRNVLRAYRIQLEFRMM